MTKKKKLQAKKTPRVTKMDLLLKEFELRRKMTHKEIVTYLRDISNIVSCLSRTNYSSELYGRYSYTGKTKGMFKPGFLYRNCRKTRDGSWKILPRKSRKESFQVKAEWCRPVDLHLL